jgi:hypothetical protein
VATGVNSIQPGVFAVPATDNLWTVGNDGRIAMLEYEPYRIRFLLPSGETLLGREIAYDRQVVNDSVKQAYLSEIPPGASGMVVDKNGIRVGGTVSRPRRRVPQKWVEVLPPYRDNAFVEFDPTGVLWIQRTTFGREGARYDLVSDRGELVGAVQLDSAHAIVGFGRKDVYVVRRDADDLEFLQRRPMPGRR